MQAGPYSRSGLFAGLALAILCILFFAFITRNYLMDDAYISLRYLDNLLAGNGLVFNPGERVEGITNVGWVFFLAPVSMFMEPPAAAKAAGVALSLATIVLVWAIAAASSRDKPALLYAAPVPVFVATHFVYAYFSVAGMETALLSALLCLIVLISMREERRTAPAFLCALAFLVHPEAGLVFPFFLAITLVERPRQWRREVKPLLVFSASIAVFTALRYSYFGDLLPHTFQAKSTGLGELARSAFRVFTGEERNVPAPFKSFLPFIFLAYGFLAIRRGRGRAACYMAAAVMAGIVFAAYAERDWTFLGRYFAPYVPVAFVLFWRGLVESHEPVLERFGRQAYLMPLAFVYGLALVLMGAVDSYSHLKASYTQSYPGYVLMAENLAGPSKWVGDNLPDDSMIATRRIGAVSYYSGMRVFDYKFGLVDRETARIKRRAEKKIRFPFAPPLKRLWKRRSPDYLLEDSFVIDRVVAEGHGSLDSFEIHGVPYRVMKKFPIGRKVKWVLCEKIE